ncbi:effector binding domain-containing protein [Paenibacillus turpanensis]|uniref:effector binding domain-containing protein n=1 Tax=Paenibacillus turpanensis TaxID=2689078 RepID=UPI00140DAF01|nr:effector binding domain-containing protein [Paenibacillus turpanensis]
MSMLECRLVQKDAMKLVGVSFSGTFPDSFPHKAMELQQQFWKRCHEIEGRVEEAALISPFFANESFVTYWACCEVQQVDRIPEGMEVIELPAKTYASVTCTNRTIEEGYRVLEEWIKKERLQKAAKSCSVEIFYIQEDAEVEQVELLAPIQTPAVDKLVERIDAVFLPVNDLEASLYWYQEVFGFPLRWNNSRMAGLGVGPNCGFHLVQVPDWQPPQQYTPINFAARNAEAVRQALLDKGVKVSDWRDDEPKRFDIWDNTGNIISLIQM